MGNPVYDIIVFGASGYTGCYVVQELANFPNDFKWCVAGRSSRKVQQTLKLVGEKTGKDLKYIEVIEADVDDGDSILNMCKQARLIINCVGPYRFFGEQIVSACVESNTHYIDVSGEPQFLESMQLKYFEAAKTKGIYVVGACGFDSIPCDLGVEVMKKNFDGDINSIETYLQFENPNGSAANFATWQSAIYGLANASELKPLRRQLLEKVFTKQLPKTSLGPRLKKRATLFSSNVIQKWCIPFIGSDRSVVLRSQMYNYQFQNQKPVQIQTYMGMSSLLYAIGTLFLGMIFFIMSGVRFGQKLLEMYPDVFSFGVFSKNPPPLKKAEEGSFAMTMKAEGWSEKLQEPTDIHSDKMNKKKTMIVKGPEPYVTTAICVVSSAFVTLFETDKLPDCGGVLTAGAAFKDTTLSERLTARGITFNMID